MGKTKTSFVAGTDEQPVKPSYDKAAKEAKRKARAESNSVSEGGKVHVAGLKGGQRIKVVEAEELPEVTPDVEPRSVDAATPEVATSAKKEQKVRSKKYKEQYSKVDKNREYSLSDAISLVKDISYSSFDGTMELHIVIKKEGFSANVTLPFSAGRQKKVEFADDATLEKLKSGKIDFDVLLTTADMMPKLVPFARLLGPRGLMPNPKNGTIVKSKKDADSFSTAATALKTEKKAPVIHTVVGKVSQKDEELNANIESVFTAINKRQIVKAYLKSTMSPSVRVKVV